MLTYRQCFLLDDDLISTCVSACSKPINLPIAGLRLGNLVLRGAWKYSEGFQRHSLSYNLGLELQQGTARVVRPNTMQIRPYVGLKHVGLQVGTYCMQCWLMPKSKVATNNSLYSLCQARTQLSLQLPDHVSFLNSGGSTLPRVGGARHDGNDEPFGIHVDIQVRDDGCARVRGARTVSCMHAHPHACMHTHIRIVGK